MRSVIFGVWSCPLQMMSQDHLHLMTLQSLFHPPFLVRSVGLDLELALLHLAYILVVMCVVCLICLQLFLILHPLPWRSFHLSNRSRISVLISKFFFLFELVMSQHVQSICRNWTHVMLRTLDWSLGASVPDRILSADLALIRLTNIYWCCSRL